MDLKQHASLISQRLTNILGFSHGGNRDLYTQFGYPQSVNLSELYGMYLRNDIASRIVRAFPQATWREQPIIRDEKGSSPERDSGEYSPFVESVDKFFRTRKLFSYLERADRLSSVGHFGVLVLGFADNKPLSEPVDGAAKFLYAAPYSEVSCQITRFDTDTSSPRYGKPILYNIQSQSINAGGMTTGPSAPTKSMSVHYSRVLHVAEMLDSDEVYSVPRLLPIYNRLKDLEKVVGGSAETFWLTATRGLAFWADKDTNLTDEAIAAIQDQADDLQHQLRRYIVGQGMTAQQLSPESADPEPNATILMDLIAGAVGIPKRILLGTERGELSSSQDENNWSKRIGERRNNFAAPFMLMPLVSKLIDTGNIPEPEGEWWCEWKDGAEISETERATIASAKSSAISTYVNTPGAEFVVPVAEFRESILGLPPETEYESPDMPSDIVDIPEGDSQMPTAPAGEVVADTALNGAQITSLKEIIEAVATGGMPAETAIQVIIAAFPAIGEVAARKIIAPLQGFTPTPETPPPARFERLAAIPASNDAVAVPLYVSRRVANAPSLIKWAVSQGFKSIEKGLHVTLCYLKTPVDASKIEPDGEGFVIEPDKTRTIETLGDGATVLRFGNDALEWRHKELRKAGASHDYPAYVVHITISHEPGIDIARIKPYDGAIVLGPEIFAEIKTD